MIEQSHSVDFMAFCRLPDERLFVFEQVANGHQRQASPGRVVAFDFFLRGLERAWPAVPRMIDEAELEQTVISAAHGLRGLAAPTAVTNANAGVAPLKLLTPAKFRDFETFFDFAQKKFAEGEVKKLVPFVFDRYESPFTTCQITSIVKAQLALPRSHDVFGLSSPDLKIFSISPEYLFWRRGRKVRTMALAGTAKRDDQYSDHEFYNDAKEIKEHTFVVLDLLERVQKLNVAKIKKSDRKIKKLKTLAHLWTEIEFEVDTEVSDEILVKTLHPTAAMLGYPRESSLGIISRHELQSQRGFFGSPIMFQLSEEETFCVINIRSLIEHQKELIVGSGCGLVPQSHLQKEWGELAAKRASVLSGLHLL